MKFIRKIFENLRNFISDLFNLEESVDCVGFDDCEDEGGIE